jgi:hypothetical protein
MRGRRDVCTFILSVPGDIFLIEYNQNYYKIKQTNTQQVYSGSQKNHHYQGFTRKCGVKMEMCLKSHCI